MIRHIVIFKLNENYLTKEMLTEHQNTFKELEEKFNYIVKADIVENSIDRDGNAPIAMVVDIKDMDGFNQYLTNPYHKKVSNALKPGVISKTKIDYNI